MMMVVMMMMIGTRDGYADADRMPIRNMRRIYRTISDISTTTNELRFVDLYSEVLLIKKTATKKDFKSFSGGCHVPLILVFCSIAFSCVSSNWVFSDDFSNRLPAKRHSRIGYFSPLCVFKCLLKLPASEDA